MSSAKRALGYRQADGVAIGGTQTHIQTHALANPYEGERQVLQPNTRAFSFGMPGTSVRQCVSEGRADGVLSEVDLQRQDFLNCRDAA